MKVRVTCSFRDINDITVTYNVGEEHDFDKERAQRIVEHGLGVYVEEESVKAEPETEVKAEAEQPKRVRKQRKTE